MRLNTCTKCGNFFNAGEKCICSNTKNEFTTIKRKRKEIDKDDLIYSTKWKKLRLQILERDLYLCQRCFIKFKYINMENLTVHHIKSRKNYPKLMFDKSNLICLCDRCNKELGTKDKLDFEFKGDVNNG